MLDDQQKPIFSAENLKKVLIDGIRKGNIKLPQPQVRMVGILRDKNGNIKYS